MIHPARLLAPLCLAAALSAQVLPYPYHVDDLPNGLRVVTMPTPDMPELVSVYLVVQTGSRNEVEPGKSGFAHFFEHMMFRGTKRFSAAQQAAIFKRIGADRNAYTTNDYTAYHTTFSKEDLDTVLMLEADRFMNLSYSREAFRTEAMAVLGEYNKNSADPLNKLFEVLQDTAFDRHPYEHTTMGFLEDIQAMPEQYDYSLEFFRRWYRPEYTTLLVVGDVQRDEVVELARRHFGPWQRGGYTVEIPAEPPQTEPRRCHVKWPTETQPWVVVAFKGPAFSAERKDMAALDVLARLAFSESSEIHRELFVRQRKVTALFPYFPDSRDPFLVMVCARVRREADVPAVERRILEECEKLKARAVDARRLARVKSNMRYDFVQGLDSAPHIAGALAGYVGRARTPAVVERVYEMYAKLQPADLQEMARRYFTPERRTIATLSHGDLAEPAPAESRLLREAVLLPGASPLVSVRVVMRHGAARDPAGKEGLAYVTARLLARGSTKRRSYEEILDSLFPMAARVGFQVDQEMTVFSGTVHRDNLEKWSAILEEMLLEPAFSEEDLERVKANTLSYLTVELRGNNDEELGKEVLYQEIFAGHPYGHHPAGTIAGVRSIGIEDVRAFYAANYVPEAVVLGLAGGYPKGFAERIARDLERGLGAARDAEGGFAPQEIPAPRDLDRSRMTVVAKNTRSTGIHVGFPISVTRGHPDWVALWLVRSWLGEHRSENSHLYQRLREVRGLNYGDYAYIEYFPRGMFQFHPDPNLCRSRQIFQIWVRPVVPENGPFALRAAVWELRKLVRDGLDRESFEATRTYLSKFVNILVGTQDRRLGYAIDSRWYRTPEFTRYVREGLARLTLDDVNRVIREYLRGDRLQIVVVTKDAQGFVDRVLDGPTPCVYQAKPPEDVLAEDREIERLDLGVRREDVKIVPVEDVFAR